MFFREFSQANAVRCVDSFHPLDQMTAAEWVCCLLAESGKASGRIRSLARGELTSPEAVRLILGDVADLVTYADLICTYYGRSLGDVVAEKFNQKSAEIESAVMLPKFSPVVRLLVEVVRASRMSRASNSSEAIADLVKRDGGIADTLSGFFGGVVYAGKSNELLKTFVAECCDYDRDFSAKASRLEDAFIGWNLTGELTTETLSSVFDGKPASYDPVTGIWFGVGLKEEFGVVF